MRDFNNLTTLTAGSEEERKSLLKRVKEKSEKAGLKLNIQKTKVTTSGLITSWQIEGKKVEAVTATMKLKTLAPWKENYDKHSQCIKKQRHHFADKGLYSQSYGFSSSHVSMDVRVGP